jgi:murein L,D-transpeptidase YcbB/YkuD
VSITTDLRTALRMSSRTTFICLFLILLNTYPVTAFNPNMSTIEATIEANSGGNREAQQANQDTDVYLELRKINKQKQLFFINQKLNLAGVTLMSLLSDLGISVNVDITENEFNDLDNTDRSLTLALYRIASLSNGHQIKKKSNAYENFKQALSEDTLTDYIDKSMPQFNAVIRLRLAINQYKRMQNVAWPQLDKNFNPKLGQGHPEIKKLRRQLFLLGDLKKSKISVARAHIYDTEVVDALKHFQQRHGLSQSGRLDDATRVALNMQVSERIEILQANLWRWLSLPRTPPSKYILVNIPSYELAVVEHGNRVLDMKVIVGKKSNPTPVMVTEVGWLTVNPTWTPTPNIVKNELLPLHKRNPNALKSRNFSLAQGYGKKVKYRDITAEDAELSGLLDRFRLVQRPGTNNALGKLRLNIKNNHYIYLHDTPAKSLFNKQYRALSHGCVRLERADRLLEHLLLSEPKATRNLAQVSSKSKLTQNLNLSTAVAVYITYQTAWVDTQGTVNWRNDLYELDNSHFSTTVSN